MSWSDTLIASYVRQLVGINDSNYDVSLQLYINSLIENIELETGLDFLGNPTATITETLQYANKRNIFVLDGLLVQPSAWQEITKVELSQISDTITWSDLVLDRDYSLINFKIRPYPIFQIKLLCSKIRPNQQIRITGKKGFSLDDAIPTQLLMFIATATSAYYGYLLGGGLADGSSFVESETSLTRTVKLSATAFDNWRGPKLFTPNQITEFEKLLNNFNLRPFYPF